MRNFYTIIAAATVAVSGLSVSAASTAPMKLTAPTGRETIIEDQPKGELKLYSRDCIGLREFYGTVEKVLDEGSIVKVVEQEDGTVWLHNVISQFNVPGWIKAEKEDDFLVIRGPQLVYEEWDYDLDDGTYLKYYVSPVEISYYMKDGVEMMHYEPTSDGVFMFKIDGDRLVEYYKNDDDRMRGSLILGLVNYNIIYKWFFTGYGDNYIVMDIPKEQPVELPASADVHENWAMQYYYYDMATWDYLHSAKFVDVAIDGEDYYIKGIYPGIPDAWVKGTLEGNSIIFPNFQMIGPDMEFNSFVYLCGGQLLESDMYEGVMEGVIDTDGFALYLEKDGSLTAETNIIFATSPTTDIDNANFVQYFEGVEIRPQSLDDFTDPVGPESMSVGGVDGDIAIDFALPTLDENGNILNPDNLYFSVYVNNELFTFTQSEYSEELQELGIKGDTDELPYNIGNVGWAFYQYETWHTVYIYGVDDINEIGIQSIYYPEGKDVNPDNALRSKVYYVTVEDSNSVEGISDEEVVRLEFLDLQGRRVTNPGNGVYIRKATYSDGTVKTSKIAVKK